jgi:alpha-L-fucosidase
MRTASEDGTIPPVQMERLKALGAWLRQNGEAIYDTTPWTHAVSKSVEGDDLRFTRKGDDLCIIVPGTPKARTLTLPDLTSGALAKAQPRLDKILLLGDGKPLMHSATESSLTVTLPEKLPGKYAHILKVPGYASYQR